MDIRPRFQTFDLARIDEYIATGQEENLFLDFKTIGRADLSNRDDKRNFSKALSGFANSSGGLLVWGVEARKNSQGIDCATGKKEIASLRLFISKLNEFTGSFVTPVVDGVEHKSISSGNDAGFAVTLVPASDTGPHVAKAGEDRYYKRSGDSFYRLEHFDLEDMFGRRPRPKLAVKVRDKFLYKAGSPPSWLVAFDIVNEGRGTAKHVYLEFPDRRGLSAKDASHAWHHLGWAWDAATGARHMAFELVDTRVIHPGMALRFTGLFVETPHYASGQYLRLACILYCEGCTPVQTVIEGTLQPSGGRDA